MSEPYVGRTGDTAGLPLPGLRATSPDGLPEIDNYDELADLPTAYNELADSVQAALSARLTQASPSAGSGAAGFRRITVGTGPPSGGVDGDIHLQVEG